MPQFVYRGRDKDGQLRVGQRFADTIESLNKLLLQEGISPTQIVLQETKHSLWATLQQRMYNYTLHLQELSIFSRQMQLLQHAGVPIVTSLKQLSSFTRSRLLRVALIGVIDYLEKGQSLASAMQHYTDAFTPMMISIIGIGENTGKLSEAFAHLHKYLEFELSSKKEIKSAFRYPLFVVISIVLAIIVINIFVIPTFAQFYINAKVELPWQTRLLIGSSQFFIHYGVYLVIVLFILSNLLYRYLQTPKGKYRWNKIQLFIPVVGKLLRRVLLIRFSQSLAIILNSGIPIIQGLGLVKNLLQNAYIDNQISQMQEVIERGTSFSQAITKIILFSPLELQIISVGEKNGEIGPSLSFIGEFHSNEIQYDLKRMSDVIGPILIAIVAGIILIVALGIYLPIWNMVNLVH